MLNSSKFISVHSKGLQKWRPFFMPFSFQKKAPANAEAFSSSEGNQTLISGSGNLHSIR